MLSHVRVKASSGQRSTALRFYPFNSITPSIIQARIQIILGYTISELHCSVRDYIHYRPLYCKKPVVFHAEMNFPTIASSTYGMPAMVGDAREVSSMLYPALFVTTSVSYYQSQESLNQSTLYFFRAFFLLSLTLAPKKSTSL